MTKQISPLHSCCLMLQTNRPTTLRLCCLMPSEVILSKKIQANSHFFFYIHGTRWLMRCQYNLSISQLRSTNKASLNVDSLQRWNSNFKKIIIWHGRYNISTTPQMKCTWFPKEQGYTKDIIYRKAYMNLPKINLNIFFLHS